jgi:hypothetical protein
MRNRILLYSISFIVVVFSSCGSLDIQKRYHRRGFSISLRKTDKVDAQLISQKRLQTVKKPTILANEAEVASLQNDNLQIEKSVELDFVPKIIESKKPELSSGNADISEKKTKNMAAHQTLKKLERQKWIHKNKRQDVPDNDLLFIVYFILCLALPPLAYYLIKEDTDTLFWVCLLCYLFAFTWLTGFQFGLLGAASVVIAILALLKKI